MYRMTSSPVTYREKQQSSQLTESGSMFAGARFLWPKSSPSDDSCTRAGWPANWLILGLFSGLFCFVLLLLPLRANKITHLILFSGPRERKVVAFPMLDDDDEGDCRDGDSWRRQPKSRDRFGFQ